MKLVMLSVHFGNRVSLDQQLRQIIVLQHVSSHKQTLFMTINTHQMLIKNDFTDDQQLYRLLCNGARTITPKSNNTAELMNSNVD